MRENSILLVGEELVIISSIGICKDGRTSERPYVVMLLFFERFKSNVDLTSQYSKYAFPKQSSGQTFSARPNPDWERRQSSCSQLYNKSSQFLANALYSSCATLVNWPTRSRMNMLDLPNTCPKSRPVSSMVVHQCRKTSRLFPIRTPIRTLLSPPPVD